jgi:1,4-dihydroxy-2-naphthoate octaprenyltransferase
MELKSDTPTKFESWLIASRPKTLFAAIVPVFVGSGVAISEGIFVPVYSLVALVCSILIQIGTNYTNDLYDFTKGADNEKRKGPRRVLASGWITVNEMKIAIVVTFLISFLLGLYLVYAGGWVILVVGIFSILAGIAYTAGPFPLAYNGLGDIFVFGFFGVIGTVFTYYLHSHHVNFVSLLASVPVGSLVTNILVVNNYRDIEEDRAANKFTLAVKMGRTFTRYQFIFLMIISFLTPLILYVFFNYTVWIFLPYITLPVAAKVIRMITTLDGTDLNKTLELTARLSALFGILFSAGLAL